MDQRERDLDVLAKSAALWNRDRLELRSLEVLAQIMDEGDVGDWRALYRLAKDDADLRERLCRVVKTVPMDTGAFWLAALVALGTSLRPDLLLPSASHSI